MLGPTTIKAVAAGEGAHVAAPALPHEALQVRGGAVGATGLAWGFSASGVVPGSGCRHCSPSSGLRRIRRSSRARQKGTPPCSPGRRNLRTQIATLRRFLWGEGCCHLDKAASPCGSKICEPLSYLVAIPWNKPAPSPTYTELNCHQVGEARSERLLRKTALTMAVSALPITSSPALQLACIGSIIVVSLILYAAGA